MGYVEINASGFQPLKYNLDSFRNEIKRRQVHKSRVDSEETGP